MSALVVQKTQKAPEARACRVYEGIGYQAASWDKPRPVIAKIEWHPGELFPKVGFIVTNLPMEPDWVARFYNRRGTAEQHIKEGKYAFHWTRLCCASLTPSAQHILRKVDGVEKQS